MIMWNDIQFVNPWVLLLIPLAIFAWFWFIYRKSERKIALQLSTADSINKSNSWKLPLVFIVPTTAILSIILFIIALARPQKVLDEESREAEGIDIVIAMDISSSMLAKDFRPDRLSVAKVVAEEFIKKREFDRIGLVVFSGEAFSQCPVTTDHKIVIDFIQRLNVGYLQDGTAIGMGIATGVNRLKESEAKSKIMILMTDGENNAGYIDPVTAAEVAREFGVKLYCIGVGSDGKAMGPVNRNLRGEYIFGPVDVKIDEELLQQISQMTGGKYFRALDENSLINIYNEIDKLEKTEIETTIFKKYRDLFRNYLLAGIFFVLLHIIIKHFIIRINP